MKLSSILMATATTSGMTPMEKMQSISLAHSSIRNGFNRPQFDAYRKKHEELFKEITQKGMRSDPEFVMAQAANLTVTFRSEPEGIAIGQFPSLDGSNNDLTGQLRGKVGDRYSRLVPPDYCPWDENSDSVSDLDGEPRCITHLGFEKRKLPNERALSLAITELNGNEGKTTEDNKNSMIGPLWGQFVTHDIIQTPDMGNGQTKCDCSAIAECKNIEVDRTTDPHFDDIDCMFVIRSAPHVPSQGNFVREQMNQKTSFLDLSQVYGASEEDLANLIASDKMHLKTRTGTLINPSQ
jgi:peroxidase